MNIFTSCAQSQICSDKVAQTIDNIVTVGIAFACFAGILIVAGIIAYKIKCHKDKLILEAAIAADERGELV